MRQGEGERLVEVLALAATPEMLAIPAMLPLEVPVAAATLENRNSLVTLRRLSRR